jgi:hypothetical protein
MKTKKIKAIELVFDWNLWPRHQANSTLDATHVKKMKVAMRAGIKFPPVIANEKDYRIIDGFHRTQAILDEYGDDHLMKVELRDYTDNEIFVAAAKLNNEHGLPLSPSDRAHVIAKARRMKIPWVIVCEALGMDVEYAKEFLKQRSAKTQNGKTIILKGGARNLKGKVLTKTQEQFADSVPGSSAQSYATLLLGALNSDAIIFTEKVVASLEKLYVKIQEVLEEVKHG